MTDEDDFSYECPKCNEIPAKGIFLGSQIWHVQCLIDAISDDYKNGLLTDDSVKDKIINLDHSIQQKIEINLGWVTAIKSKSKELMIKEFEESVTESSSISLNEQIDKKIEDITSNDNTHKITNNGSVILEDSKGFTSETEKIKDNFFENLKLSQDSKPLDKMNGLTSTNDLFEKLKKLLEDEYLISIPLFRDLGLKDVKFAEIYCHLLENATLLFLKN